MGHDDDPIANPSFCKYTQPSKVKCAFLVQNKSSSFITFLIIAVSSRPETIQSDQKQPM